MEGPSWLWEKGVRRVTRRLTVTDVRTDANICIQMIRSEEPLAGMNGDRLTVTDMR